jgi:uncharacterized membrane protein
MDIFSDTIQDAHPIIVHFPIALLIVSAAVTIVAFIKSSASLQQTSWLLLWLGTFGAIFASITGLIAHVPYEETELHSVIETHQFLSLGVTGLFISVSIWRLISRLRGADIGTKPLYLVLVLVGVAVLSFTGMKGGDLVFDYGINVRGINPLLEQ